ncbi:MAG: hypothetical protein NZO16_02825 [Deltaproteobacteria bacterium]|nr:hypothetical protein [Deltaproteobacteria bacterium]
MEQQLVNQSRGSFESCSFAPENTERYDIASAMEPFWGDASYERNLCVVVRQDVNRAIARLNGCTVEKSFPDFSLYKQVRNFLKQAAKKHQLEKQMLKLVYASDLVVAQFILALKQCVNPYLKHADQRNDEQFLQFQYVNSINNIYNRIRQREVGVPEGFQLEQIRRFFCELPAPELVSSQELQRMDHLDKRLFANPCPEITLDEREKPRLWWLRVFRDAELMYEEGNRGPDNLRKLGNQVLSSFDRIFCPQNYARENGPSGDSYQFARSYPTFTGEIALSLYAVLFGPGSQQLTLDLEPL